MASRYIYIYIATTRKTRIRQHTALLNLIHISHQHRLVSSAKRATSPPHKTGQHDQSHQSDGKHDGENHNRPFQSAQRGVSKRLPLTRESGITGRARARILIDTIVAGGTILTRFHSAVVQVDLTVVTGETRQTGASVTCFLVC